VYYATSAAEQATAALADLEELGEARRPRHRQNITLPFLDLELSARGYLS
jgi:hypothetical protein